MNITSTVVNAFESLTLSAGEKRVVNKAGSYFVLKSNSLSEKVEVAIGKDNLAAWDVLWSFKPERIGEYFDKVTFRNPSLSSMTIEYVISNGIVKNESAEILGIARVKDVNDGFDTLDTVKALSIATLYLFDNAAVTDEGGGLVGLPLSSHSLVAGDSIYIQGTTNYNGIESVVSATSSKIVIAATYVAETLDGVNSRCNLLQFHFVPGNANREVITLTNLSDTYKAYVGGSSMFSKILNTPTVTPPYYMTIQAYAGIQIEPGATVFLNTKDDLYVTCDILAGNNGVYISPSELL